MYSTVYEGCLTLHKFQVPSTTAIGVVLVQLLLLFVHSVLGWTFYSPLLLKLRCPTSKYMYVGSSHSKDTTKRCSMYWLMTRTNPCTWIEKSLSRSIYLLRCFMINDRKNKIEAWPINDFLLNLLSTNMQCEESFKECNSLYFHWE